MYTYDGHVYTLFATGSEQDYVFGVTHTFEEEYRFEKKKHRLAMDSEWPAIKKDYYFNKDAPNLICSKTRAGYKTP